VELITHQPSQKILFHARCRLSTDIIRATTRMLIFRKQTYLRRVPGLVSNGITNTTNGEQSTANGSIQRVLQAHKKCSTDFDEIIIDETSRRTYETKRKLTFSRVFWCAPMRYSKYEYTHPGIKILSTHVGRSWRCEHSHSPFLLPWSHTLLRMKIGFMSTHNLKRV
jgi:hypothetical protein